MGHKKTASSRVESLRQLSKDKGMKLKILLVFLAPFGLTTTAQASEFTSVNICKAAISVEMGRPTKSMKTKAHEEYPEISYRHPDGDFFRYRCQVTNDRVIWSAFMDDTEEWGRWRNRYSEGDASTTYSISNGVLTIHNDQSGDQTFNQKDF